MPINVLLFYILKYIKRHLFAIDTSIWLIISVINTIYVSILVFYSKKSLSKREIVRRTLSMTYTSIVIASTILSRNRDTYGAIPLPNRVNLDLFGTIFRRISGPGSSLIEVVLNVLLFIPLGMLLAGDKGMFLRKAIAIVCVLVLAIETMQLLLDRGFFELSDIFENVIGATLGFLIARIIFVVIARLHAISDSTYASY